MTKESVGCGLWSKELRVSRYPPGPTGGNRITRERVELGLRVTGF